MDAQQENSIIARVQAGQVAEFAHLVSQYQNSLFRIVGNIVPSAMVEDVVQEVFLTAFSHIRRFDPARGRFRTWLFRMARNCALNAFKKKRELPMEEDTMITIDPHTPIDDLLRREMFQQLDRAISQLSFQERVIFVLAELEGLSYAEIARIEKIRLGTVKSRLARVRARLRTLLQAYKN